MGNRGAIVVSRAEAINRGLSYYWSDKPCSPAGHIGLRRDPAYAIRQNMASRLSMAIRKGLGKKSASTMALVGCKLAELMAHLEGKFLPGMTWKNYGLGPNRWHCDHIVPCASFDLRDQAQQRACFHFTNLQPLWQPDNLRKGAKRSAA